MMSQHLTFVHLNMARLFAVYFGIPEARRMRNAWVRVHHYVIVDYKRTAVRNVLSEYALLPNSYPVSALILSIVPV